MHLPLLVAPQLARRLKVHRGASEQTQEEEEWVRIFRTWVKSHLSLAGLTWPDGFVDFAL